MATDFVALAVLTVAAFATRAAGFHLAGFVIGNPRVEHLLKSVSGCVIATLIAPALMLGDNGLRIGVVGALVVFMIWRNTLLALVAASLLTALFRFAS